MKKSRGKGKQGKVTHVEIKAGKGGGSEGPLESLPGGSRSIMEEIRGSGELTLGGL